MRNKNGSLVAVLCSIYEHIFIFFVECWKLFPINKYNVLQAMKIYNVFLFYSIRKMCCVLYLCFVVYRMSMSKHNLIAMLLVH